MNPFGTVNMRDVCHVKDQGDAVGDLSETHLYLISEKFRDSTVGFVAHVHFQGSSDTVMISVTCLKKTRRWGSGLELDISVPHNPSIPLPVDIHGECLQMCHRIQE